MKKMEKEEKSFLFVFLHKRRITWGYITIKKR
jgi:hypothetical protein